MKKQKVIIEYNILQKKTKKKFKKNICTYKVY